MIFTESHWEKTAKKEPVKHDVRNMKKKNKFEQLERDTRWNNYTLKGGEDTTVSSECHHLLGSMEGNERYTQSPGILKEIEEKGKWRKGRNRKEGKNLLFVIGVTGKRLYNCRSGEEEGIGRTWNILIWTIQGNTGFSKNVLYRNTVK